MEAINLRADRARDADELLLSLVLIVLDPLSPITYKDQAYMPNAFNTAIVCESVRGGDYKALSESILHDIPDFWEEVNEERRPKIELKKLVLADYGLTFRDPVTDMALRDVSMS